MSILEDITPLDEERIYSKLKHITFCRTLIFFHENFKKEGFAYLSDLAKLLKTSYSTAYTSAKLLENLNLVKFIKKASNFVEIVPVMEGNPPTPKINKYIQFAKKTLGVD